MASQNNAPTLAQQGLRHIGIIMDGNGRWAKQRGKPRKFGHREGAKTFRRISEYCHDIGLEYLTVYAFSTENWSRPRDEVDSILRLLEEYIDEAFARREENDNVRTLFLGDLSPLSDTLRQKIRRIEQLSAAKTGLTVNIALNYGGRDELVQGMRRLAQRVRQGELEPEQLDEAAVSASLYTAGQPDPDLIIRPSGEQRLSNFMIWQAAYAEFVFLDILWPDFTPKDLDHAIQVYLSRQRRFGGL